MLLASGLPKSFWRNTILYAVWLRNRTPTKKTAPKSPYEVITGNKPDLSRARRFGCRVWVRVYKNSKLDERGVEAVWIGPSAETPDGQKIFWPKKSTITVERNVRFDDGSVFGEGTSEGGVLTSEQQSQQSPAQTDSARTSEPQNPVPHIPKDSLSQWEQPSNAQN
jgi:hypothetical protein